MGKKATIFKGHLATHISKWRFFFNTLNKVALHGTQKKCKKPQQHENKVAQHSNIDPMPNWNEEGALLINIILRPSITSKYHLFIYLWWKSKPIVIYGFLEIKILS